MKKLLSLIIIMILVLSCSSRQEVVMVDPGDKTSLERFSEMKFGLFIHWGLYAIPAGEWKGKYVRGIGEWIMLREQIPVKEYAKLAEQFNPVKFNADEWAQLAEDAGMKYLVITSKHHDGFSMFHSKACSFNIVDATPFGRDPMTELAAATEKRDIAFGFYYSQAQDWAEPNASGNTWDFPEERDPAPYVQNKVFPQVTEILNNYGDLALIWFDTPRLLTKEQVVDLKSLVKKYQPDCLVNNRIGYDQGDYEQTGDNIIPPFVFDWQVWEIPATLNHTWGYKKNDDNWKEPYDLLYKLADIVSKGGNYLLNVGPDARGVIPIESQNILRTMGKWLAVNGEAIYGTSFSPLFMDDPSWRCTVKPGKMYIHVFDNPGGEVHFKGLESRIRKAYLLKNGKRVKYSQKGNEVSFQIPPAEMDEYNTVVVLELRDEVPVITEGYGYRDSRDEFSFYSRTSRFFGEDLLFERDVNAVTGFLEAGSPQNEIWWNHFPYESGRYKVSVEYACPNPEAGSSFFITNSDPNRVQKERLEGKIEATGGDFMIFGVGELQFTKEEWNLIRFGLQDDFRSANMKFRRMIFEKI